MPRRLASLLALACSPCASVAFIPPLTRREALLTSGAAFAASAPALPAFAAAAAVTAAATPLQAAWTATDGFSDASFINFDEGAYAAMRDDEKRTPLFERAIQQRLAAAPANTLTVLDLGTGPFALLALAAARAGAKKVYTIEANKEAAKRARDALRSARVSNVEVIEGFSTAISLPEKVDVLVAEIAGSVASEEGAYATIRDAQARFLKRPYDPASYIPARIETLAAPCSYAIHYALGPPRFDWTKLKEPVRLNCRDESMQLLASPQRLESIAFADPDLPSAGLLRAASPLSWTVDAERVASNRRVFYDELVREGAKEAEASELSEAASKSFSGIALWPRLVLDPEGALVVESRGPRGEHAKSHWQTVVPLMAARPAPVGPSQMVTASFEVDLRDGRPNTPLQYSLTAQIVEAPA